MSLHRCLAMEVDNRESIFDDLKMESSILPANNDEWDSFVSILAQPTRFAGERRLGDFRKVLVVL